MSSPARNTKGLSLIELMIALLIGIILLLGVVQIFSASRTAYQLSEGLARTQENGRFAMDYLQRDIRMVGHFGCVNDQARLQTAGVLTSHINATTAPQLDFTRSIQGFEATNTGPTNTVNLATPATGWSPALPTYLSALNPRAGSDIVLVRFLTGDGVPVTAIASGQLTVGSAKWDVLTQNGVADPALFGVADCSFADIFQATSVTAGTGVVTASVSGLNATAVDFAGRYTASPAGPAMLHRADAMAYYVGTGASGGPALFRTRFTTAAGGAAVTTMTEELVEGVENMQLLYGRDQSSNLNALTGNTTQHDTANTLAATEAEWRRVNLVQVGLLVRSPDPSAAAAPAASPRALGTQFTLPADGRYRSSYEATVAMRNRLYGN